MTIPLARCDRARTGMAESQFDATAQKNIERFVGTAEEVLRRAFDPPYADEILAASVGVA